MVAEGVLPGPQPSDAELLATLGIDLDAVLARLEESFGWEAYYDAAQLGGGCMPTGPCIPASASTPSPTPADGTAKGDTYARGNVWLLRYRPRQIDDDPLADGHTEIQIDRYLNRESIHRQDVVVWYEAHFTHDASHEGAAAGHGHIVGSDLVPNDW